MPKSVPAGGSADAAQRLIAAAAGQATPVLLMELNRIAVHYQALHTALPEAEIFYAVKANPHPQILARLAGLGCAFDIASPGELVHCRNAVGTSATLSYGNPIKKERDISAAFAAGVDLFAFDSPLELAKLARAAPGARVFCRLGVAGTGAEWPLTHKFGCAAESAPDLLCAARDQGLRPVGVSFHVGSQQTKPDAWRHAIHHAAEVFRHAAARGIALELLNLGGGLPAHYSHPTPPLTAYADTIHTALQANFGASRPRVMIEPGRYMVTDAGALVTEVVLVADRPHERVRR